MSDISGKIQSDELQKSINDGEIGAVKQETQIGSEIDDIEIFTEVQTNEIKGIVNNNMESLYLRLDTSNGPSTGSYQHEGLFQLLNGVIINEFSDDGTLVGDSDLAVPTEKAVKTYIDTHVGDNNFWDRIGTDVHPKTSGDTVIADGGLIIGIGEAGVDYSLIFNGETNDGIITWLEDEAQFSFVDKILYEYDSVNPTAIEKVIDTVVSIENTANAGAGIRAYNILMEKNDNFDMTGFNLPFVTTYQFDHKGTGTILQAFGVFGTIFNKSTGTITKGVGFSTWGSNQFGGTFTDFVGLQFADSGGTTVATNNYAFEFGRQFISNSRAINCLDTVAAAEKYLPFSTDDTGITFDSTDVVIATTTSGDVKLIPFDGVVIGDGTAGKDYTLTFNGETNDGILTWMEDEDYFDFIDTIKISNGIKSSDGSDGWTGTFNNADGATVTVKNGIITDVS